MKCRMHESARLSPARRDFLRGATGAAALLVVPRTVSAASVDRQMGELYVNGERAAPGTPIKPGDQVLTGPNSSVAFAVGEDAFLLRQLTALKIEGKALITGLRILTGALVGVFGRGDRRLHTTTATVGIRGTGVYIEANPVLTYLCTCYGEVELECVTYRSRKTVTATNHTPNYIFGQVLSGRSIMDAPFMNHTNAELATLEKMVGRESPLG